MKKLCMYAVVDIKTGFELVCGVKYKDFDNGKIRYIYDGQWRDTPFFWRKITFYYRTITIKGRECVIVYWAGIRKQHLGSLAYFFKGEYFLRAQGYFLPDQSNLCDYLIEDLGVA